MGLPSLKIFLGLGLLVAQLATYRAEDPAENLTEPDTEAEFRQGGIGQQLMANYPVVGGGLGGFGSTGGFQYMNAGSGNAGQGYVNMLRNLYRPPSLGLTDKVKHWVKSFMNRRQYVKPYYNPSMGGLQYSADEFGGKPVVLGGNTYKAFSVPLRQLQKYYKPYYQTGDSASQYLQSASRPGSGSVAQAGSSMLGYSPNGAASQSGGLYASESANGGNVFSSGSPGLFGTGSDSSNLFSGGSGGNIFPSGAGSSGLFSQGDGSSSGFFNAANLPSGSLYSSGGGPSSGLFQGSAAGSGSSVFSMDSSSNGGLYGSDGGSAFYGPSSGGSSYGSAAAASSLLSSLGAGPNGQVYGDLFASGASPSATIYNPNSGDQGRGYGSGPSHKKQSQPSYGASSSALYMSSDHRNADSFTPKSSAQEPVNSFNVDSSRNSAEPSYSVSFQPAQGKSLSASSGFQPVAFSSDDGGFKGSSSFLGKSS